KIWQLDYGDGFKDTLSAGPFNHSYTTSGIYNIKLKIIDSSGCFDTVTIARPLLITKPIAQFSAVDSVCPSTTVRFSQLSSGVGLSYLWDFGDSTATSTGPNPNHTYVSPGNYTVKLNIKDQYGCLDSIIKLDFLKTVTPTADFAMSDSEATCPPLVVQFTDSSIGGVSRIWDFGDSTTAIGLNPSHFYTYPGTYVVKLTTRGHGTCTSIKEKTILIKGPRGTFNYTPIQGCAPVDIDFTANTLNTASYIWDFNGGTTTNTTDSTISHIYTQSGTYIPKMILIDTSGCKVPIIGIDTIVINNAEAHFTFVNKSICDAGFIFFNNTSFSSNLITSYNWNFGDGSFSTSVSPIHVYTTKGVYHPILTITNQSGCVSADTAVATIKVAVSPRIGILVTPYVNGCISLTDTFKGQLIFNDTSTDSIISYKWDFGDGASSTAKNPVHVYNTAGLFTPSLTVKGQAGCTSTYTSTEQVKVVPSPQIDILLSPSANGCTSLTDTIKGQIIFNDTSALTWNWDLGNGVTSTLQDPPVQTYTKGIYPINLKVTNSSGCADTATKKVIVNETVAGFTFVNKLICDNDTIVFVNTSTSTDSIVSYNWDFGDGATSTEKSIAHIYATAGLFTPSLTIVGLAGCTSTY
ncbi:MAG: PKD domain-containing protein, partial [Sphingobacteriales bacterium]|nr:PKD domain-containing protein [Sphingobacteriales bacterium]